MSLLWRDEVGIYVSPTRIILNRMQRGLRPQGVADLCLPVTAHNAVGWLPAMELLQHELADKRWHNANARIIIGDPWIRYAMLPPTEQALSSEEKLIHARMVLSQLFGAMDDTWYLTLSDSHGNSTLVCAIATELLQSLKSCLQQAKLRTVSVQPQLVAAFNCWRDRLPDDGGWFVSLDQGSLAAAHLTPKGWDRVHSVRIGADWALELRRLSTFGRISMGDAQQGRVFVDAPLWLRKLAHSADDGLEMLEENAGLPQTTLQKLVSLKAMHP